MAPGGEVGNGIPDIYGRERDSFEHVECHPRNYIHFFLEFREQI
jgi:hypothetical protein